MSEPQQPQVPKPAEYMDRWQVMVLESKLFVVEQEAKKSIRDLLRQNEELQNHLQAARSELERYHRIETQQAELQNRGSITPDTGADTGADTVSTTNHLYLLTAVFPNGSAPLRVEQSREIAIDVAKNLASNVTMLITNYDTIGNCLAMDSLLSIDVYEFVGGKARAIVWRENASDLCDPQDDECLEQEQTQ